jgi:Zn finger protein HypA/HybF involved in hydrogenase expression
MATVTEPNTQNTAVEPDELAVEEVHCSDCGVPMSAIPGWYAKVNVRFTCDNCRSKSPRLAAGAPDAPAGVSGVDLDLEAANEDTDADDADLELEEDDADMEE